MNQKLSLKHNWDKSEVKDFKVLNPHILPFQALGSLKYLEEFIKLKVMFIHIRYNEFKKRI